MVATYWVKADRHMDIELMGQILAIEQTTGTLGPGARRDP